MPSGKPETTFEWTCAQCGAENRAVDSLVCRQCGKERGDEKCLRHFKLTPETGFYGLHSFKVPKTLSDAARRLARYGLKKVGLSYLIPERKRGAKKGGKQRPSYHR